MTKFTKLSDLLGQEEKPKGKPIEFKQFFDDFEVNQTNALPKDFNEVMHLGEDQFGDVFRAIDGEGLIYIYRGHLNDGFIEQ